MNEVGIVLVVGVRSLDYNWENIKKVERSSSSSKSRIIAEGYEVAMAIPTRFVMVGVRNCWIEMASKGLHRHPTQNNDIVMPVANVAGIRLRGE